MQEQIVVGDEIPLSEPPRPASAPRHMAPQGATDCHFHIFGPHTRYALGAGRGYTPSEEANIDTYRKMAETIGLDRVVIVNPTPYGTDHSCTIDSIEQFGRDRARAVAVIDDSFTPARLRELDSYGFCAARVNNVNKNATRVSELQSVLRQIEPLGWHLEVYVDGRELPGLEATLLSLPVDVVIDHMGRIPTERGMNSPEFQALLRLLGSGKCWVKLVGYRCSSLGPPYSDLLAPARALISAAPEKCVWGTDWPHPRLTGKYLPDDGRLLDMLNDWVPDQKQLHRILVENPARLYGFGDSAA